MPVLTSELPRAKCEWHFHSVDLRYKTFYFLFYGVVNVFYDTQGLVSIQPSAATKTTLKCEEFKCGYVCLSNEKGDWMMEANTPTGCYNKSNWVGCQPPSLPFFPHTLLLFLSFLHTPNIKYVTKVFSKRGGLFWCCVCYHCCCCHNQGIDWWGGSTFASRDTPGRWAPRLAIGCPVSCRWGR